MVAEVELELVEEVGLELEEEVEVEVGLEMWVGGCPSLQKAGGGVAILKLYMEDGGVGQGEVGADPRTSSPVLCSLLRLYWVAFLLSSSLDRTVSAATVSVHLEAIM